jgi:hypothetical protein
MAGIKCLKYHPLLARTPFHRKLTALFGSALIGYYPLWETSGTTVTDKSGNGRNGVYTGGSLNNATSPVKKPAPTFTGAAGGITLGGSAAFLAAFNGNEGAFMVTIKLKDLAQWLNGTADYLLRMEADANNLITLYRNASTNYISGYRKANSGSSVTPYAYMKPTAWVHIILSWSLSGGYFRLYQNGVRNSGASEGVLTDSYAGQPASTKARVCALSATVSQMMGWASDAAFLNRPITDAEALTISKAALPGLQTMSFIGDSITYISNAQKYPLLVANEYHEGFYRRINHSQMGHSIADNFAAQVAEAAGDNANIIIIQLGRNDNNAGDMSALQTIIRNGLDALHASNPGATIYWRNVLPAWTDVGGGTPVDLSNIRAAVAAACAAKGVTCWDSFTTPWIAAGDTSDGTHPTTTPLATCGHRKIADKIMLLLP